MSKICILCKERKDIVWHDWESSIGSIDLCVECLSFVMPEECKNLSICNQCGKHYLMKFKWAKVCFSCWLKNKRSVNAI